MKKLKVAIVTPGTFVIPSASNSSVEKVVEHICERLSDKVAFTLLGKRDRSMPAIEERAGLTYIRPFSQRKGVYLSSINRWLKKLQPDIIQIENRPRFVPYLRSHLAGPIWLNLHSTRFITPPYITMPELSRCLDMTQKIIVNSHFLKERLIRMVPRTRKKIFVNHLGVDLEQFVSRWTPEGEALRQAHVQRLGYEGKQIILFAGRLIEQKGVHHVLEIMPDIVAEFPNVILVIVGSAYYGRDELTPYVSELHQLGNALPSNVLFIPFQPHHRMADWFRLADITIVPSFEDEAFGLVNVEAMACGVPVLAASAGGMKEIIVDGQTGYLLNPLNLKEEIKGAVAMLLANEPLRKSLGEAGALHVRANFTWDQTAERMLKLYYSHA